MKKQLVRISLKRHVLQLLPMFGLISELKFTIFSIGFLALLVANIFFFGQPLLGLLLLVWFLMQFGRMAGNRIAPGEHPWLRWMMGTWLLLSLLMITGSVFYYSASLRAEFLYILALIAPPVVWWIGTSKKTRWWHRVQKDQWSARKHQPSRWVWLGAATILALLIGVLGTVLSHQTIQPIRSLWDVLPTLPFFLMGGAIILLFGQLMRGTERTISIVLSIAVLFCLISTALFVFPIGYGFDSFLHQATESHIAEFGTITPKPFYYIGQYSLVTFVHHAFSLPVDLIDRALLPLLAALLLPIAFYRSATHWMNNKKIAMASVMLLFLIPLSAFIVTTPQGIGNLWFLLILLASVTILKTNATGYWLIVPAIATALTHPIAGIPAVFFTFLLMSSRRTTRRAATCFWTLVILGSIALPASFFANSLLSSTASGIDWSQLNPVRLVSVIDVGLFFENRFSPLLDFVYLYGLNSGVILGLFALWGWWHIRHQRTYARLYGALILILSINFLLLSTIVDFSFLIDYERANYAGRLKTLLIFSLIPLGLLGFCHLIRWLKKPTTPTIVRWTMVGLLCGWALSNWYITYPTNDAYGRHAGFNVSQSDISTVYAIEEHAGGTPYIVLANQSVSAAAVRTFGFAHYFGEHFYYPIPTGGALYQEFLNMNERPSLEPIKKSAALADTSLVFYVVNDYWWESQRLIETSKQLTDEWISLDDGAIHVFVFDRLLLQSNDDQ